MALISKIYWINDPTVGDKCLGIMPRPRGNDWLEDEIRGLKFSGIDYLVSLLEYDELDELGLDAEAELCDNHDIGFINLPIADGGIPGHEQKYLNLVHQLAEALLNGKKVVVHSRTGIGRSSLLCAGILISLGVPVPSVFEILEAHREIAVPDTDEQEEWLMEVASRITIFK
jgi:protein-tyrosine phosphatase